MHVATELKYLKELKPKNSLVFKYSRELIHAISKVGGGMTG